MEDEKSDMVLRQVVETCLKLASHRFDKIRALFRHQDQGEYDASLDVPGPPLLPDDSRSQNILISDVRTSPRITAIIDWEFIETACASSFAQYLAVRGGLEGPVP